MLMSAQPELPLPQTYKPGQALTEYEALYPDPVGFDELVELQSMAHARVKAGIDEVMPPVPVMPEPTPERIAELDEARKARAAQIVQDLITSSRERAAQSLAGFSETHQKAIVRARQEREEKERSYLRGDSV